MARTLASARRNKSMNINFAKRLSRDKEKIQYALEGGKGAVKHITWHCARHSFSVLLQDKGTDVKFYVCLKILMLTILMHE